MKKRTMLRSSVATLATLATMIAGTSAGSAATKAKAVKKKVKPSTTKASTAKLAARKQFPNLAVTDIISAKSLNLSSLAAGKPTVFWFWAPT
jgi:ribosomal protein L17